MKKMRITSLENFPFWPRGQKRIWQSISERYKVYVSNTLCCKVVLRRCRDVIVCMDIEIHKIGQSCCEVLHEMKCFRDVHDNVIFRNGRGEETPPWCRSRWRAQRRGWKTVAFCSFFFPVFPSSNLTHSFSLHEVFLPKFRYFCSFDCNWSSTPIFLSALYSYSFSARFSHIDHFSVTYEKAGI